jgi:hypothetical protein
MAELNSGEGTELDFDMSSLSDADQQAYAVGNWDGMSIRGLQIVENDRPPGISERIVDATGKAVGVATEVGRDIYDWTRGAKVSYPNLPILGQGIGVSTLNLSAKDQARFMTLVGTTLDPDRLAEGIVNIIPNATTSKDEFGNVIANVPVKNDKGEMLGYKNFYPNPRGLDIPTATQLTGATALYPLIEAGVAAVGIPNIMGAPVIATAGIEATGTEVVSALAAEDNISLRPMAEGTGFGAIFYGAGRLFSTYGGKLLDKFRKAPATVIDKNAKLQPEAIAYLKSVGIDPDEVQVSVYGDLERLLREGAIPDEALAKMAAQGLPVPVNLTTGQITGDLEQQLLEDLASKGVYGDKAKDIIRAQFDGQQSAIKANIAETQSIIARGGPTVARTQGGQEAQAALVRLRKAAQENADNMYTAARNGGAAYLDPRTASSFGEEILETVGRDFNRRSAPTTLSIIDDLSEAFNLGQSLDEVQAIRTQLTNQARNQGSEGAAASRAVKMLDQKLYDMAEQNLLYGSNEAVALWSKAIVNYSQFKDLWQSKGGILNRLTKKEIKDGPRVLTVAPQAVAKEILGSSFSGLISKPDALRTLKTLKAELPEVEWNMLRQEAFMMISDGIISMATGKSANTFAREWRTATNRNPALLTQLFSPSEMTLMNNLADTTARINRTAKNASNSGAAIGSILGRIFRSLGSSNVGRAAGEWFFVNGAVKSYGVSRVRNATEGVINTPTSTLSRLILGGGTGYGGTPETEDPVVEEEVVIPPQASVSSEMLRKIPRRQPAAVPTKFSVSDPTNLAATPDAAPPPSAVAQGPSESSEMMARLFPMDMV